jgi:hypothetical protein
MSLFQKGKDKKAIQNKPSKHEIVNSACQQDE